MKKSVRIMLFFYLLIFLPQSGFSQDSQSYASARFAEANSFYKKGNYKEAIQLYEEVLSKDLTSGTLYYNLGNSYFKVGRLGKAILNYERASQLVPRDNDLNANYDYALSLIKGQKIAPQQNMVMKIIGKYENLMTINEFTLIVYLLSILLGIIFLFGLYRRWPYRHIILLIAILGIASAFHGLLLYKKIQKQSRLAVVITSTESGFEPIDNTTIHFELPEGEMIEILNEESGWFKLRRPDGKIGWSRKETIEKL